MNKNILVTGGAGYVGAHACKCLSLNGWNPVVYDNLSTGHPDFCKWGPLEIGDFQDTRNLRKIMSNYKPVAVMHFAASAYVSESIENPLKYYNNNVSGTLSLISALKEENIRFLIFSSTCATYGNVDNNIYIDEKYPQNPINPYGRSKLFIEKVLSDLDAVGILKFISLRYFNAAGSDISLEIGELHKPETQLIPLAIQSALNGKVFKVYGGDYSTPDGTAIRDYIDVEDLACAHVTALNYLIDNNVSDYFNLGTGKGYSVLEIINALSMCGVNVKYNVVDRRDVDINSHLRRLSDNIFK